MQEFITPMVSSNMSLKHLLHTEKAKGKNKTKRRSKIKLNHICK